MKTLKVNGKTVKVYDGIDEMPVVNFQKYNRCLLIDSGIGSDVDSVDSHIVKLARLVHAGDKEKALQELQNLRQNLYMINNCISPKHMAFAAVVHSVDGTEVTDLSDDGLKLLMESLNGERHGFFIDAVYGLKKKLILNSKRISRMNSTTRKRKRHTIS